MSSLQCYQCNGTFSVTSQTSANGDHICPQCGSEFVEVVEGVQAVSGQDGQIAQQATSTQEAAVPETSALSAGHFGAIPQVHQVFRQGAPGGPTVEIHMSTATIPITADIGQLTSTLRHMNLPANVQVQVMQMDSAGNTTIMPFGGGHPTTGFRGLFGGFNPGDFAAGEGMDAIITRLMDQYQPRQHPTSQQVLDQLPRIAVSKAEAPGLLSASTQDASDASIDDSTSALVTSRAVVSVGEPCTVCHDTFQAEEQVLQLPCNHCFHEDCIMPWLKEHNTCPVCRASLPSDASRPSSVSQPQPERARRRRNNAVGGPDSTDTGGDGGPRRAGSSNSPRAGRTARARAGAVANANDSASSADTRVWDSLFAPVHSGGVQPNASASMRPHAGSSSASAFAAAAAGGHGEEGVHAPAGSGTDSRSAREGGMTVPLGGLLQELEALVQSTISSSAQLPLPSHAATSRPYPSTSIPPSPLSRQLPSGSFLSAAAAPAGSGPSALAGFGAITLDESLPPHLRSQVARGRALSSLAALRSRHQSLRPEQRQPAVERLLDDAGALLECLNAHNALIQSVSRQTDSPRSGQQQLLQGQGTDAQAAAAAAAPDTSASQGQQEQQQQQEGQTVQAAPCSNSGDAAGNGLASAAAQASLSGLSGQEESRALRVLSQELEQRSASLHVLAEQVLGLLRAEPGYSVPEPVHTDSSDSAGDTDGDGEGRESEGTSEEEGAGAAGAEDEGSGAEEQDAGSTAPISLERVLSSPAVRTQPLHTQLEIAFSLLGPLSPERLAARSEGVAVAGSGGGSANIGDNANTAGGTASTLAAPSHAAVDGAAPAPVAAIAPALTTTCSSVATGAEGSTASGAGVATRRPPVNHLPGSSTDGLQAMGHRRELKEMRQQRVQREQQAITGAAPAVAAASTAAFSGAQEQQQEEKEEESIDHPARSVQRTGRQQDAATLANRGTEGALGAASAAGGGVSAARGGARRRRGAAAATAAQAASTATLGAGTGSAAIGDDPIAQNTLVKPHAQLQGAGAPMRFLVHAMAAPLRWLVSGIGMVLQHMGGRQR